METQQCSPHPALQPYVRNYLYLNIGVKNRWSLFFIYPTGSTALLITGKGKEILLALDESSAERYKSAIFFGQPSRFKKVSFYDRLTCFFVLFQPWGAYRFLDVHQSKCNDLCFNLGDLVGPGARNIEEELAEQSNLQGLKSVVEKYLLKRLQQKPDTKEYTQITQFCRQFTVDSHYQRFIKDLCPRESCSLRTLERRMKKMVGLTPKKFQRIIRFNAALRYLERHPGGINGPELARRSGYYDHAHLIKEFNYFYGATPAQCASEQRRFLNDVVFS